MGMYVPMDCGQVEDKEAELQAAKHQIVRGCYICKSTGHSMAKCFARKAYLASKGRRPTGKPSGLPRGSGGTQKARGALLGKN
ncbi:unnamed protein product [Peronospora belbahrii]|uniref:CCHC-type domain-containing protein n=1 Tax=Peronospora belbahrii TaxID=622444 RepID=A0AAU9KSR9_9STRA|nr:unnamed protein product [Peronospora belbahrii]